MPKKLNKKIILYIWLALLILGVSAYYLFPKTFNLAHLLNLINANYWLAVTSFSILICLRGLLFISPLSLTLASSILFSPLTTFIINTLGFLISTILIYKFSEFLGLADYFEKKYPKQIIRVKNSLEKKEIPLLIIWSFLPFLPTDLIIYVSATLKIKLWKCVFGVFIGTAIINAIFIYSLNFFFPLGDASLNTATIITNNIVPSNPDNALKIASTSPTKLNSETSF